MQPPKQNLHPCHKSHLKSCSRLCYVIQIDIFVVGQKNFKYKICETFALKFCCQTKNLGCHQPKNIKTGRRSSCVFRRSSCVIEMGRTRHCWEFTPLFSAYSLSGGSSPPLQGGHYTMEKNMAILIVYYILICIIKPFFEWLVLFEDKSNFFSGFVIKLFETNILF